jgi:hypothetical protein
MKSKKGMKIIEAEKDFRNFKEFLQYVGTFLIFLGIGLIFVSFILLLFKIL